MQTILTLWVAALQLLLLANNPNISADLKAQATRVANQAIQYAQTAITTPDTTFTPITPVSLPNTPLGGTVPDMITTTLKPAYTYNELIGVFNSDLSLGGVKQQYMYNKLPIEINLSNDSVNFSYGGGDYYGKWEVDFQDKKVLTKSGNEIEFPYEDGVTFKIHERTWVVINNLIPNTEYHYQFVYHEEGREDTVIDNIFKTLTQ